ncbi:tape measure protein [Lactiplantibacillus mudanjiangensis]|uniref:Phage tail tape measure protein [Lactobacillus sp.] n=1 Tax=Lactiplantibacillus mudanjiangensis TaxID=1296538 RepID=A0A660E4J4_9LACO|nr:tape measure protein [Lactiplantibacillus mudanjiangensis]VDG26344.1 phage tail tape measure protein [Lactobacillus sp.] [Lactiplantibacillus mudanjiangensis]VDG27868.1 phage tail tape measure protein [Lactobacillus sp.] [Lactiplantibacillus mudanjiangensis]
MADGTVTIDLLMNTKSFMSDRERVSSLLKTLGSDAGDQMDQSFAQNASKVRANAEQTHSKIKADFDSPIYAKLVAQAEDAGITNFKSLLERVPKQQRTELVAKANRGEAISWEDTMRQMPREVVTKMKLNSSQASIGLTELKGQTKSTEKSFTHLHEIIAGTFIGSGITTGIGFLVNGLKEAAKAGMAYNKEQDTMKTVWTALTTESPKDGKELISYINTLSQHSIYAAGTIDKMSQSFYHVHSNVDETKRWTDSFVALGSTLHMSNDALAESGEQFAKIVAGGKASSEDMAVMINRFPMFGEALQDATGKSMKQLYAMSAAGKLTATQFTEALDYLGKKYKGGTAEAMTSFQGMSMYIKSRWSVLTGDIMASSFKMSKGITKDMKNLLSDDMMKKYANLASGAISTVTGWLVKLIKYVDGHRDTIIDIIGNLGTILGIIGKTAWTTFSDIIYDIVRMFGLAGDNAKGAEDPLDKFDDALKGLSKNKKLVEDLTKAFIAMFALKKGIEFIAMLASVRKALVETAAVQKITDLVGFGSGANAVKQATTETVAQTAAETGGKVVGIGAGAAGASKLLAKVAAKGGATSTAELAATSGLGGSAKLLAGGLSKALPFASVLAAAPELMKMTSSTVGKHLGGATGAVGGSIAGAAAGTAVMPVVGTAIGGIAGGFAGTKLGQSIGDSIQKGVTSHFPKLTAKMGDFAKDTSAKMTDIFSTNFKPSINDKEFSKKYTSLTNLLNSEAKVKFKIDTKNIDLAKQTAVSIYGQMGKAVENYYAKQEKSSDSNYKLLVKNGAISKKQADALLAKSKANDKAQIASQKNAIENMKSLSSKYYDKLDHLEEQKNSELSKARKADGKNTKAYYSDKKVIEEQFEVNTAAARKKYLKKLSTDESKMNDQVTKATKIASGKQLDLLENLKDHKGKLSKQEMTAAISTATKERNTVVKSAKKTRDSAVNAAQDKYKKSVAAADKERYETKSMGRKQYNEVIATARKQRDDAIDAADETKNKTVKKAEETHTKVVDEATKQAGEHKDAVNAETGDVLDKWNKFISDMSKRWDGMIDGINGVLHALNKSWGNLPHWGSTGSKHAAGLNGSIGEHMALVGEDGYEYMGTKDGAVTPIGVDGPEIRNIPSGASILPHGMSVEFGRMAANLPGYKVGLPGWLTDTFSALKSGAEGAADLVSKGASGVINKMADATGVGKLVDQFKDQTTAFGAIATGTKNSLISNAVKYVQSFFDQFSAPEDGSGSGSLVPHFGSPFKESSGYGPRAGGFHKGIDFAAPLGTPIPAQYGGTVVQAGPASGFGNWVVIKPSGASVDTIYGHMKRMKVKTGQHVKAGQIIAWVGSEGQSSGPHVHYELRAGLGGKSYNPMTYGASAGKGAKPSGSHMNWLKQAGFKPSEYAAANKIISAESGWSATAQNPHSSAYGIAQNISPSSYASFGSDWKTNPITQLKWMKHYVDSRYGGANQALAYRSRVGWYANGGWGKDDQVNIFNDVPGEPEVAINPARQKADSLIMQAASDRVQHEPTGLVAKAMHVIANSKQQRYASDYQAATATQMTSRAISRSDSQMTDMSETNRLLRENNRRPIIVKSVLDGKEVGRSTNHYMGAENSRMLYANGLAGTEA